MPLNWPKQLGLNWHKFINSPHFDYSTWDWIDHIHYCTRSFLKMESLLLNAGRELSVLMVFISTKAILVWQNTWKNLVILKQLLQTWITTWWVSKLVMMVSGFMRVGVKFPIFSGELEAFFLKVKCAPVWTGFGAHHRECLVQNQIIEGVLFI